MATEVVPDVPLAKVNLQFQLDPSTKLDIEASNDLIRFRLTNARQITSSSYRPEELARLVFRSDVTADYLLTNTRKS